MGAGYDLATGWSGASTRARVVAMLLFSGAIQGGMALACFAPSDPNPASRRAACTMGGVAVLLTLLGIYLACSQIIRSSPAPDDWKPKLRKLFESVVLYALIGPMEMLAHRYANFEFVHCAIMMAGVVGLMHLTTTISKLLRTETSLGIEPVDSA